MKHKKKGVDQNATEAMMLQAYISGLICYEELLIQLCEKYFQKADTIHKQISDFQTMLNGLNEGGEHL